MRTYYIEEKKMDMTYLNLRLLLSLDCDLKYKKINRLINFLNNKGFIVNLSIVNPELTSIYMKEETDIMSLTIEMNNDKMQFKFWNGISALWLYHLDDLFDALETGRNTFSELYDKYEPVTSILFDFKNKWKTSVYSISYNYHPENDDVDLKYHIVFFEEVKNTKYTNKLLKKIENEINMLGEDVTKDLNFRIEHSFRTTGCLPCQKAKEEREKNEE